jgi:hypothetical protein
MARKIRVDLASTPSSAARSIARSGDTGNRPVSAFLALANDTINVTIYITTNTNYILKIITPTLNTVTPDRSSASTVRSPESRTSRRNTTTPRRHAPGGFR